MAENSCETKFAIRDLSVWTKQATIYFSQFTTKYMYTYVSWASHRNRIDDDDVDVDNDDDESHIFISTA